MIIASSPGRLDVMGGIADYSGALVLQMPIQERTHVKLIATRPDLVFKVKSEGQYCEIDYRKLLEIENFESRLQIGDSKSPDYKSGLTEISYEFAKKYFRDSPKDHWASYVVGCMLVLQKEKGIEPVGFEIEINSNIPIGKGVSSSAALEVAAMKAFGEYFKLQFVGTELAILAQKVENYIVDAPCGLMDQLASCFGKSNELLPIICQPDILLPSIKLPTNLHFVGIDSGVRHSVGGALYSDVRTAAFMGLKMINSFEKTSERYLANISVADFEQKYASKLPKSVKGSDFMEQFGTTDDPISTIKPETNYPVYQATAHPIYEQNRIQKFTDILKNYSQKTIPDEELNRLGQFMYESHESYSACGLGSHATDKLVDMVKENSGRGVYGAKITGGGSGGTVCILCNDQGLEIAHKIHEQYCQENKIEVRFFG